MAPQTESFKSESRIANRYRDGYHVAKFLRGLGIVCKAIGLFGGLLILAVIQTTLSQSNQNSPGIGFPTAQNSSLPTIAAFASGLIWGINLWVLGALLAAFAQL
jgi:hypothetical protein